MRIVGSAGPSAARGTPQALDGGEVVGFGSDPVGIKGLDGGDLDRGRVEGLERGGRALLDPGGLVFEPGLIGRDLMVWAGRSFPSKRWKDWNPIHENSWLSQMFTKGQRARASWMSGS